MMDIDWSNAPKWANEVGTVNGGSPAWLSDSGYCFHGIANPPCHPYNAVNYTRDKFTVVARRPWTGEGLPPVGMVCDVMQGGMPSTAFDWERCTILLINEGADGKPQVCTRDFRGDIAIYYPEIDPVYFRPARTAEQIEKEEREVACRQLCIDAGSSDYTGRQMEVAYKLYDAGYRKQEKK